MREAWSQDQLSACLTPGMGFCSHGRGCVRAWQIEHMQLSAFLKFIILMWEQDLHIQRKTREGHSML